MSKPPRVQFPGALYHVTARGNRKQDIFLDDRDRLAWLDILGEAAARYNFIVHGFCQMTNHYHLLLETVDGNLSDGARQLNGEYARHFNHRHGLVGHVFQGPYYSEHFRRQSHMLEVARYIVLNPVRAGMTATPDEWRWSSYAFLTGAAPPPPWFDTQWLLSQFGDDPKAAIGAYINFVAQGKGLAYPVQEAAASHQQASSGSESSERGHKMKVYPRSQRSVCALPLAEYASKYSERNEAMARAYLSTAYSMQDIASHFGVSCKTVSRAVQRFEVDNS